ncbi:MAG: hypothetical protein J5755_01835 [Clostridia bacterium]|nr:hypothetical protein [Clostridia bacterium]
MGELILKLLQQFFYDGLLAIFTGIFGGIGNMFNFVAYGKTIKEAAGEEGNVGMWVVGILMMVLVLAVLVALVWVIIWAIVRLAKRLKAKAGPIDQDLVDEITELKRQLVKTNMEKDRILGLKIGHQGYDISEGYEGEDTSDASKEGVESRFYKLTEVDKKWADESQRPIREYDDEITLEQICDRFRNYAANNPDRPWRKLYYEPKIVRLFFASMATTRLLILQGISGTGKTSLPECMGHFLDNPTTIASVQPSWRDRTEIFGYFNEFTKRFNETEVLKAMYDARYSDDVYITVMDEMNIARVEYYFAELLSILEMPSREQWVVDLVPSGWPSDPKYVEKGRFKLPENMWYVGTANNDDSTFAISDKVYDRGMPININSKAKPFDCPVTEKLHLNYHHLEDLYSKAMAANKVSEENVQKFADMDDYVIEHFRLAFGNRIVKQLNEFVPVYVACGGTEIDGLDYVLCNKILRKFESLNLAYIRDEIDNYIEYLSVHFGEENMMECKEYLARLKKLF